MLSVESKSNGSLKLLEWCVDSGSNVIGHGLDWMRHPEGEDDPDLQGDVKWLVSEDVVPFRPGELDYTMPKPRRCGDRGEEYHELTIERYG
jgi:hypothetical protein